jgi:hypothetical protein
VIVPPVALVAVGIGVALGIGLAVGLAVAVGVAVAVLVRLAVAVGVLVALAVPVAVAVFVGLAVGVGVAVAVLVAVAVIVGLAVAVGVAVLVAVAVGVFVGVALGLPPPEGAMLSSSCGRLLLSRLAKSLNVLVLVNITKLYCPALLTKELISTSTHRFALELAEVANAAPKAGALLYLIVNSLQLPLVLARLKPVFKFDVA